MDKNLSQIDKRFMTGFLAKRKFAIKTYRENKI